MEIYWSDKGEKIVNNPSSSQDTLKRDVKHKDVDVDFDLIVDEAWKLHLKNQSIHALSLIDFVLKLKRDENYYNIKAVIYDNLTQFEDACRCYDEALKINPHNRTIRKNKVEMQYLWAEKLYLIHKKHEKALVVITNAIDSLNDCIDDEKFWYLKSRILSQMKRPVGAYECDLKSKHQYGKLDEFESQIEYLKTTDDILVNVTGTPFYKGMKLFKKGIIVNLTPEPENEADKDAIKVELDGEKIGYVANSPNTLIKYVKSTSEIKDKIKDRQKAEIQFIFAEKYIIAKLISKDFNEVIGEIKSTRKDAEKLLSEMDDVIKSVKDY